VLHDRECVHVRIRHRLAAQGRSLSAEPLPPKDHSKKLKPGSMDVRPPRRTRARQGEGE
jgi:hypothetical protein